MKKFLAILITALLLFGCSSPGNTTKAGNATVLANATLAANATVQPPGQANASVVRVASGDVVYLDYVARTLGGVVYDTTVEAVAREAKLPVSKFAPVKFVIGRGELLPAVEEQVVGMAAGEAKSVVVPPERAFGVYSREKVMRVPLAYFGEGAAALKPGNPVTYNKTLNGVVVDVFQNYTLIDFNPPLAGQTLVFEVAVRNVSKAG